METPKRVAGKRLWEGPFLDAFSKSGNLKLSCQVAQVDRTVVWATRNRDPEFAERYAHAQDSAVDHLEAEAWRRAIQGVERIRSVRIGTDKNGKPTYERLVEREFSDVLLIFLLKANRPEKYRDTFDLKGLIASATGQAGTPGGIAPDPARPGRKGRNSA